MGWQLSDLSEATRRRNEKLLDEIVAKHFPSLAERPITPPAAAKTHRGTPETVQPILEADFQAFVVQLAQYHGWAVAHFRPAQNSRGEWRTAVAGDGKGFTDLTLVKNYVLFVELKTDTGTLRAEQKQWRQWLEAAGAEYRLWRPKDVSEIERILSCKGVRR